MSREKRTTAADRLAPCRRAHSVRSNTSMYNTYYSIELWIVPPEKVSDGPEGQPG